MLDKNQDEYRVTLFFLLLMGEWFGFPMKGDETSLELMCMVTVVAWVTRSWIRIVTRSCWRNNEVLFSTSIALVVATVLTSLMKIYLWLMTMCYGGFNWHAKCYGGWLQFQLIPHWE